jgi:PleD family two-component response regulator
MRSKIRSYEPIVRYGGDEFVCCVAGVTLAGVRTRFSEINTVLGAPGQADSLSVGLAELRPGDTLASLIDRADEALIEGRCDPRQPQG